MDFSTLFTGEDLTAEAVNKSAVQAASEAEIQKAIRIHSKQFGCKAISNVMFAREAKNPISQTQYDTRLYVLKHIIRNPRVVKHTYPFKDDVDRVISTYTLPDKLTSLELSSKDIEIYFKRTYERRRCI